MTKDEWFEQLRDPSSNRWDDFVRFQKESPEEWERLYLEAPDEWEALIHHKRRHIFFSSIRESNEKQWEVEKKRREDEFNSILHLARAEIARHLPEDQRNDFSTDFIDIPQGDISRWAFNIESDWAGVLVCYFYPAPAITQLKDFLQNEVCASRGGQWVEIDVVSFLQLSSYARQLLLQQIRPALKEALETLIGEIKAKTVVDHDLVAKKTEQIEQVLKSSNKAAKKRLGAPRPGRPPTSKEDVLRRLKNAVKHLQAQGKRITKAGVAECAGMGGKETGRRVLNYHLRQYGIPWKDIIES